MKITQHKAIVALSLLLSLIGQTSIAEQRKQYYFNPDGGKYIHTNARCSTISSKYWPIMQNITLDDLKKQEYRDLRLCSKCNSEIEYGDSFFKGKKEIIGQFDVSREADENYDYYIECWKNALEYLIDDIGDPEEQYKLLVEGDVFLSWGYPSENDISKERAISIAYAAIQKYIGIPSDELNIYYAEPWLNVEEESYHEWMVRINKVVNTYKFYNSRGYYVYINADNGLISKIRKYK